MKRHEAVVAIIAALIQVTDCNTDRTIKQVVDSANLIVRDIEAVSSFEGWDK